MYIKLGFNLFVKKIFLNLICILQISATLIVLNMLIAKVNYESKNIYAMRNFPDENVYFNMVSSNIGDPERRALAVNSLINKYSKDIYAEQTKKLYGIQGESIYSLLGYGKNTLEYWDLGVNPKLLTTNNENQVIPCLAYEGQHKIGDKIDLSLIDNEMDKLSFEVVGLLKESTKLFDLSVSSNGAQYNMFFDYDPNAKYLIFCYTNIAELQGYEQTKNSLLFFSDQLTTEQTDTMISEFSKYSWIESNSTIRSNSLNELWIYIQSFFPLFICLCLVGLISSFCLAIMNTLKNIRTFSIYYICGMNWIGSIRICFGYILCMILGAILLSITFASWIFYTDFSSANGLLFNEYNIIFSLLLIAIIMIFSMLPSAFLIRKEDPLTSLKNGW